MRHATSATMRGHSCLEHWMCLLPEGEVTSSALGAERLSTAPSSDELDSPIVVPSLSEEPVTGRTGCA